MQQSLYESLMEFVTERKCYEKGQYVLFAGDKVDQMGLVLSGSIQIEQNDFWGNRTILDKIGSGGFFAETYAITGEPSMVDVEVTEDCDIAFIPVQSILNGDMVSAKMNLSRILVTICSKKNLKLSQKILCTSPKTIRERLTAYLSYQASVDNAKEFDIPFDRQQLADYLNLDRSAMSAELSRMRQEGLLETKKNHFVLKK